MPVNTIDLLNNIDDIKVQNKLINEYKYLVTIKARTYFLVGADYEDLIQEGMIGLFNAIQNYKVDLGVSFETFADTCINNQILTAIKMANRQKHKVLNESFSLNTTIDGNEILNILTSEDENPENLLILKENKKIMERIIEDNLTTLEKNVLKLYLTGESYDYISKKVNKNKKSIDNALQRIKKKLSLQNTIF
ncbi:MAG: sigma-70 family RNA polymerase sigma factor [Lachnospirales bacterium]